MNKIAFTFVALCLNLGILCAQKTQIKFEKYSLPNGLTVMLHQDLSVPVVAVTTLYHVGSKHEETVDKITADQVEQAANKYINLDNETILVVGKADDIKAGLEKYGNFKYYDIEGNEVVNTPKKQVQASKVTPAEILQNAMKAMLKNNALSSLKDITLEGTISFNGQIMNTIQKYLLPNKASHVIEMSGMAMMSQLITEDVVIMTKMDNEIPMSDLEKEDAKMGGYYFVEQFILDKKLPLEYKGTEKVDGAEAHVIKVTVSPTNTITLFYDVNSGLKLQMDKSDKDGPSIIKYQDYKDVNGFNLYSKTTFQTLGFNLEYFITNIKINQGLVASDFKK